MKRKFVIAVVLVLVAIAAVWVLYPLMFPEFERRLSAKTMRVLDKGERFVLLSLDPDWLGGEGRQSKRSGKEIFQDYAVLGKMEIRDPKQRAELLAALYKGIEDSDGSSAKCFEPRHGISATLDGKTVELVICFACSQIVVCEGEHAKAVLTSGSAKPAFNQALEKAGLPLAKDFDPLPGKQGDSSPRYKPVSHDD